MAHVHTNHRGRTYDPHPVPHRARLHNHVAQFFSFEGDRQFTPSTNGRELAEELSRNLRPSARRTLLETEAS
jgi:hypothetical protein